MKYWRTPLDVDEIQVVKGRVIIIEERCKGCEYCIAFCPRNVLSMSKTFNVKGYHFPETENETQCVSCHFCEAICPEFAIFSVADEDTAPKPMK